MITTYCTGCVHNRHDVTIGSFINPIGPDRHGGQGMRRTS